MRTIGNDPVIELDLYTVGTWLNPDPVTGLPVDRFYCWVIHRGAMVHGVYLHDNS